jgi:glycosyltransferase involved in cell wall biosynthesis
MFDVPMSDAPMSEDNSSFVSVIIPVFNDHERLKLCLQALESQTYPQDLYEIIVIDNASHERVEETVRQFRQVSVAYEKQRGSYAARNKGILLAKGEILAFTDSDCIPASDWIETGVRQLLSTPGCGLVAGRIEVFFNAPGKPNAVELYDSITFLQQQKYVREYHFGATANLFALKKTFNEVGYFNDRLKSGGDMEWGHRVFSLGYPVIYADDSCVRHPARKSLAELYQKVKRISRGHYEMIAGKSEGSEFPLSQFIASLSKLKPPLISTFRKVLSDERLKNKQQKAQVFFVELAVHYLANFEKMRLQLIQLSNDSKK